MTDYICLDTLRVGATELIPGDRLDIDGLLQRGDWPEQLAESLKKRGRYAELSREKFVIAVARRPAGSPWPPRGFTEAFLAAAGLATPDDSADAPPADPGAVTNVELTEDKVAVGPNFYQPKRVGRFTYFDVCDAEGRLLRASAFRDEVKAREFLEELYTNPADAGSSTGS